MTSQGDPFEAREGIEPTARPAEAREPWELRRSAALAEIAREAAAAALPLAVAVTVVCELRLMLADLGEHAVKPLDAAARAARVRVPLSDADAAYVRLLSACSPADRTGLGEHVVVAMPSRLTSRLLGAGGPQRLLQGGCLERSRAWERAAVLEGRTMSEWAALAALRARNG